MTLSRLDDASSFLFGVWRSRPRSKRIVSAVAVLMAVSGVLLMIYPVITNAYSSRQQARLAEQFGSPQFASQFRAGVVEDGQVLTRIIINKIEVDSLVVEGTDAKALRAGAGHYKHSAFPCKTGNVAIAGHRTTYGKPFHRLDELKAGEEIVLITPSDKCTYKVVDAPSGQQKVRGGAGWITHPNDGAVVGAMKGEYLTLTTCHPKGSAAKRLILRAQLVRS